MRKLTAALLFAALPACGQLKLPPPPRAHLEVVQLGDGNGTIRAHRDDDGCGVECLGVWGHGDAIEIEAVPAPDARFTGWLGDCSGTGRCWLPIDRLRTVGARFEFNEYTWLTDLDRTYVSSDDDAGDLAVHHASGIAAIARQDLFTLYSRDGHELWSVEEVEHAHTAHVAFDEAGNVTVLRQLDDTALLTRYTQSGGFIWQKVLPLRTKALACAPDGRVAIAGMFAGTLHIGALALKSQDGDDVFVALLSREGELMWADASGGPGSDEALAVAFARDRVAVAGLLDVRKDADDAPFARPFVRAYSTRGEPLWSFEPTTTGGARVNALAPMPDGTIVVAGELAGSLTMDGLRLAAGGSTDAFVAALAPRDGATIWARRFGGTRPDRARAVAAGEHGDILVTGDFSGDADFGETTLHSPDETSATAVHSDAFLVTLGAEGAVKRARRFGTSGADTGEAVAIDGDEAVWLSRYAVPSLRETHDQLGQPTIARGYEGGQILRLAKLRY